MKLEEAKEATVSAVIVLPTVANEPRKPLAIRLNAKVSGHHRSGCRRAPLPYPSIDLNGYVWNHLNAQVDQSLLSETFH